MLGSQLGARAVQDPDHDYDEAMALQIEEEMQRLGPQAKTVARAAGEAVKGSWFVGAFIRVTMTKRHLDVGLDDGFVTPWLVPNVAGCGDAKPQPCPVPDLSLLEEYGFRVKHEIHPKEWERGAILRAVYPQRQNRKNVIVPDEHFGVLIEHVEAMAQHRYGPYACLREAPSPAETQRQVASADPRPRGRTSEMEPAQLHRFGRFLAGGRLPVRNLARHRMSRTSSDAPAPLT